MSRAQLAATVAGPDEVVRGLVGSLSTGPVLEIGPGAAPSARWLASGVRWTGVEPDADRRVRGARLLRPGDRMEAGVAEALPLADGAAGGVIGVRVLCSVRDQAAALAEIRRVLAPGGRYVFLEHVVARPGSWRRYVQKVWSAATRLTHDCRPDRATGEAVVAAGFDGVAFSAFTVPGPLGIELDVVVGTATVTQAVPSGRW